MFRYADNALILCPSFENYDNKSDSYYTMLKRSVTNIVTFLKSKDITPCMLTSDEIACVLNPDNVTWWQTMSPGDELFAKKYCEGVSVTHSKVVKFPELYTAAMKKYPMASTSNVDLLFDGVLKRTGKVERELIKTTKVIFNIQTPNSAAYNIKPKAGSEVILVNIHNGNFIPNCYLSDMNLNPIELLDYPLANRPVYEWRFDNVT